MTRIFHQLRNVWVRAGGEQSIIVRAWAGSLWVWAGEPGENGTVIGEEGSKRGKSGGGEALEAVEEHMVHSSLPFSLHTLNGSSPPASLPLSLSSSFLLFALRTYKPPSLFLILHRDGWSEL